MRVVWAAIRKRLIWYYFLYYYILSVKNSIFRDRCVHYGAYTRCKCIFSMSRIHCGIDTNLQPDALNSKDYFFSNINQFLLQQTILAVDSLWEVYKTELAERPHGPWVQEQMVHSLYLKSVLFCRFHVSTRGQVVKIRSKVYMIICTQVLGMVSEPVTASTKDAVKLR